MPEVTREGVANLAALARLELSEQELDHLAPQLEGILGHVSTIAQVTAEDIVPTTHALPLTNVTREDAVADTLGTSAALHAAPAAENDRFRVPQILGEDA
jgi:aspartyl-tRNA(Asn)/glutamyl-tRNA(Gln) amidotransferase subunit C